MGYKSLSELQLMDPPLPFWKAFQLRNFVHRWGKQTLWLLPLTEFFEKLCTSSSLIQHGLSLSYKLLSHPLVHVDPPYIVKWESDLGISLLEKQKTHMMRFAHTASLSSTEKRDLKIWTHWHRVPTTLHNIFRITPSLF